MLEEGLQYTKLTLAQCFQFCRTHDLLCKPVESLVNLRKWHEEMKDFAPSLAARGPPSPPPLRAIDAAGAGHACIDEFLFSRLLNDLDPMARCDRLFCWNMCCDRDAKRSALV